MGFPCKTKLFFDVTCLLLSPNVNITTRAVDILNCCAAWLFVMNGVYNLSVHLTKHEIQYR